MAGIYRFKSAKETFDKMPNHFVADRADDMKATYQYNITGAGGGTWACIIQDRTCKVVEGEELSSPDATITCSAKDWIDLNNEKLSATRALMTGKLKIKGNMMKAMKLEKLFE